MAKAMWMLAIMIAGVVAEPPVGRQYLPPSARSTQFGAPARSQGGFGGISTQYGAPSQNSFGGSNHQRGSQHGGHGRNSFGSAPSTQYGAPSRNNGFGGAHGASSRSNSIAGSPSSQYGAPSTRNSNFGASLNNQYHSPSQQYGAPSAFSANAPAAQYGAPNNQGGRGGYPGGNNGYAGDQYDEPANYQFSWEVNDPQSGNDFGHEESRQGDQAEGKYYVLLPDGRRQIVEYTANEEGYKPMIRYEGEANNGGYPSGGNGGYPRGGNGGGHGGPY